MKKILSSLTIRGIATPACALVRNDALLRHSEAVTDVTAVGIFAYYLPRSVYRKIATPV